MHNTNVRPRRCRFGSAFWQIPSTLKGLHPPDPACSLQSFMELQYALTFGKVKTDGHRLLHTDPVSRLEIAERARFLQSHLLANLCDLPGHAGRRGKSERIGRSGEGGGEGDGNLALFDLRQLTGGLVARQFAALHPDGLISVVLVDR